MEEQGLERGFWSNVADWLQGKVNEAGDYLRETSREERPSYVDTPLYTMERDNSVANAYNNWLASERNRAAQAEAQARQAEYNAAQFGAQTAAQAIMNQFNMKKYADAEAAKLKAELNKDQGTILSNAGDAYSEWQSKLVAADDKGKTPAAREQLKREAEAAKIRYNGIYNQLNDEYKEKFNSYYGISRGENSTPIPKESAEPTQTQSQPKPQPKPVQPAKTTSVDDALKNLNSLKVRKGNGEAVEGQIEKTNQTIKGLGAKGKTYKKSEKTKAEDFVKSLESAGFKPTYSVNGDVVTIKW